VRIAPVEVWCDGAKKHSVDAVKARAGTFVAINPASMWWMTENGERFRNWNLVGDDLQWIREATGDPEVNSMCEHMLEMD
jgi:hypothetical protein